MAGFYITTTGSQDPVIFDDLGARYFDHPTSNYDLSTEYAMTELTRSEDVAAAISAGHITVTDANGLPLDYVKDGSRPVISHIFIYSGAEPYIEIKETSYYVAGSFVYPGANIFPISFVKYIVSGEAGLTTANFQIFDKTNLEVVGTTQKTGDSLELVTDTNLSNIPATNAIFEIRVKSNVNKYIRIYSLMMG